MKSLNQYILEELDDNIFWLLDTWFTNNQNQFQEFIEIVVKCKQSGQKVNIDDLKSFIKGTSLEINIKEFINFLDNTVEPENNKDYIYSLKQVIEIIIGNKSKNNKYLNGKPENI